ncbi:hypothetical protein Tco_1523403 [Tanacetum coccineum]
MVIQKHSMMKRTLDPPKQVSSGCGRVTPREGNRFLKNPSHPGARMGAIRIFLKRVRVATEGFNDATIQAMSHVKERHYIWVKASTKAWFTQQIFDLMKSRFENVDDGK